MSQSGAPVTERLSDIGIQRELGRLPGWSRRGSTLTKTYRFASFPAAITFVTRVADVAESMDHHPDIDIRHTRLTFTLSTHDAGGITTNDLSLAREIERRLPLEVRDRHRFPGQRPFDEHGLALDASDAAPFLVE